MTQMLNTHQIRRHPVFAWRMDMERDLSRLAILVLFRICAKQLRWDYMEEIDDTKARGQRPSPQWPDARPLAARAAAAFLRKITTR